MIETKIQLSTEEMALMQNAQWILTKNGIMAKVVELFGAIAEEMKKKIADSGLPWNIRTSTAKISRGENYKGLPYIVLDYPRVFSKEEVFAIRTLFWWGNYFSVTLHLKGSYVEPFRIAVQKNLSVLSKNDFRIGISDEEWIHEVNDHTHQPLHEITAASIEQSLLGRRFVKLSAKLELQKWNDSATILLQLFSIILQTIDR